VRDNNNVGGRKMGGLSKRNIKIFSVIITVLLFLSSVPLTFASQEIIDSDYKKGEKLKVSVVLYKDTGEIDDEWDYYAIKVTVEDIKYKNNWRISPLFATVQIFVPIWAEEVPTNHQPIAKTYWWGQKWVTFTFHGISFDLYLPKYKVEYYEEEYWLEREFRWEVKGAWGGLGYGFIFSDYAEFAVGIRVPQGKKPYADVSAWVAWYRDDFLWFTYITQEGIYGVYVDPPGAVGTVLSLNPLRKLRKIYTPRFILAARGEIKGR